MSAYEGKYHRDGGKVAPGYSKADLLNWMVTHPFARARALLEQVAGGITNEDTKKMLYQEAAQFAYQARWHAAGGNYAPDHSKGDILNWMVAEPLQAACTVLLDNVKNLSFMSPKSKL